MKQKITIKTYKGEIIEVTPSIQYKVIKLEDDKGYTTKCPLHKNSHDPYMVEYERMVGNCMICGLVIQGGDIK